MSGAMTTSAAPAIFSGELGPDAAALALEAGAADEALAELPPVPDRSVAERRLASEILAEVRASRRAFLGLHADAVYDAITDGRTRYVRLPELVDKASERFPGLVPTGAQMKAERACIQAHKEGREIDQGILCGALLGSPTAGRHLIDAMLRPVARSLALLDEFGETGRADLGSVLVERRGPAAHVTFHNGHCLNAESERLIADMETAIDLVLLDDQVRVGVLRGGEMDHPRYRGRRVFSAGINLKDLRDGRIPLVEFLLGRELGYINKMLRGVLVDPAGTTNCTRTVQKPWIGAVESFAIGGGMQLLLVLDRVIAETGAYFSLPAADEGIVPGLGNLRLPRRTGARVARDVILGGRRIMATDPEAALMCDEVVPPERMDEAIDRAVRELSVPAVAANRRMLAHGEEPVDVFREYLAEFAVVQVERAYSEDVLAKVERRWQASESRRQAGKGT
ncbi:hypothetical protein GCM10022254_63260 [Actinomadura meridiana]|uniref:3,5-dihydroxyphenylacetyl-CoA monooxygenase n=1 Tax=Actinomadura meridiana TaxID=559626 RepID=A0ABP8CJH2_9ACTN